MFLLYFFSLISFASSLLFFFFFNDTATTEIYTLSLHDALPISPTESQPPESRLVKIEKGIAKVSPKLARIMRSEEHTSELQSQSNLVCRLLLEKKKKTTKKHVTKYKNNL